MKSFKEQIEADVRGVFINGEEFADEHNIDGQLLTVVIDRAMTTDKDLLYTYERPTSPANGVYTDVITVYVSLADLGYKPAEGQMMHIDGEIYFVQSVADDMGMLAITLEGNRS